ncbi:MAG: hypothetical protein ACYC8V_14605 [Caulobacteraceae bacterium]
MRFEKVHANESLSETFGYDALNRLKTVMTNSTPYSASYDAEGDIQTKSDVGTYSYVRARARTR